MVVAVTSAEQRQIDSIWRSWGDLTRFYRSMRIAAAREQDIWASVRAHTSEVKISTQHNSSGGTYEVTLDEHLAALGAIDTLNGLVLVQSWSLAEALCRVSLKTDALQGKVEDWAPKVLAPNGRSASDLSGGIAAVVESYVVRNAVAHAQPTWTTKMSTRVETAGGAAHRRGEKVDLSDGAAEGYRLAVRGLMRLSGLKATTQP